MNTWHRFRQWLADGFDIISMSNKALSGDPLAWESTIQKFEARDRLHPNKKATPSGRLRSSRS